LSFGFAASASLTLWCALGVMLARRLSTRAHWRWFNGVMAALLVALVIPTWL
jgi:threonine/homoserine/homoserine lactone efflux protein